MLEVDLATLFLGVASGVTNFYFLRLFDPGRHIYRLIIFSLIADIVASFSTTISVSQSLLTQTPQEDASIFLFLHVPFWIFSDIFQTAICLDFAMDRALNFTFPFIYDLVSHVSTTWCSFACVVVTCLLSTGLLIYEVEKLSGLAYFDGSLSSFFQQIYLNFYFNVLQWMASLAVFLCVFTAVIAFIRYRQEDKWDQLTTMNLLLIPGTITCVVRCTALALSSFIPYVFLEDSELQLMTSRLISTAILFLIQPVCHFLILRTVARAVAVEKAKSAKRASYNRKKARAKKAILAPAFVIDATALSIWSTPKIGIGMTTREIMEERANRERSVSFYQVVRHNTDAFMPETPFGDSFTFPDKVFT